MSGRIPNLAVESLIQETVYAHAAQMVVEALVNQPTASPTTPTGAGISQMVVGGLFATDEAARISQFVIEGLFRDGEVTTGGPGGGGGTRVYGWAG